MVLQRQKEGGRAGENEGLLHVPGLSDLLPFPPQPEPKPEARGQRGRSALGAAQRGEFWVQDGQPRQVDVDSEKEE